MACPREFPKVPDHGSPERLFKVSVALPAKFSGEFCAVKCIAQIMTCPVCYMGYQIGITSSVFPRVLTVKDPADQLCHADVGSLVAASNIIGFTGSSAVKDKIHCSAVISDIQPVPDVEPAAVNRYGFLIKGAFNDMWDELLLMLPWTEVVGATRYGDIHAIGPVIGAHRHVGRSLAGRIGATRGIGGTFGEKSVLS